MNLEELKEKRDFIVEEGKARNDKGKHITSTWRRQETLAQQFYILLNRTNEECLRDSDTHIRRRGANAYTDSRKAIPKEKGDSATNI